MPPDDGQDLMIDGSAPALILSWRKLTAAFALAGLDETFEDEDGHAEVVQAYVRGVLERILAHKLFPPKTTKITLLMPDTAEQSDINPDVAERITAATSAGTRAACKALGFAKITVEAQPYGHVMSVDLGSGKLTDFGNMHETDRAVDDAFDVPHDDRDD